MKGGWLIVSIIMASMLYTCNASTNLHPLILVPGNGGNQLEGRLTNDYNPKITFCKRLHPRRKDKDGWFNMWFDLTVLLPPSTQCFADRMMLYYDAEVDDYRNAPGVQTRVTHFGSTQSLRYLNPHFKHITSYMEPLVESLEQLGYKDGENLFGAPYDFRYGLAAANHPSHVGSKFLQDLKNLIESSSTSNAGKPVILVTHSLGGLFVLQLLNRNPLSWRQKYIKHFIALSTPWGGTVTEMLAFASGYSLGVPLVIPILVREEQRSSESNLWLMPSPKTFGSKRPLVIAKNYKYTANDNPRFLNDIGFSDWKRRYNRRIFPLTENLTVPEVPITCIIGSGVDTAETLFYGEEGFDKQPDILYGDGDGTVNMVSLMRLEMEWGGVKNQPLKMVKIPGLSHTSVLEDEVALGEISKEICSINSGIMRAVY